MKKNILSILSLIFCLAAPQLVGAQDLILGEELVVADYTGLDLSNNFIDLEIKVAVTNNTSEVLELKWERIVVEKPEEWDSQICDNYQCYGFNTSTNWDLSQGLDSAFVLQPGETFDAFALHVWPRMTAGCGEYAVRFTRINAPNNVLAEVSFDVSVNTDENCMPISSTQEQAAVSGVSLYPNPTSGQFTLTNNEVVKSLTIFNLLGKQVKQVNYISGNYVDVSDLADGLYLVGLQNADGQILKTLRLSKRGFQP